MLHPLDTSNEAQASVIIINGISIDLREPEVSLEYFVYNWIRIVEPIRIERGEYEETYKIPLPTNN